MVDSIVIHHSIRIITPVFSRAKMVSKSVLLSSALGMVYALHCLQADNCKQNYNFSETFHGDFNCVKQKNYVS